MGKGQIISYIGNGLYSVKVIYGGRNRVQEKIDLLNDRIADLTSKIAAETDELKIRILTLQKTALQKDVIYLQNGMPDDLTTTAWCADKTEDLSGDVGIIEIPGEDQFINIQPGYNDNAVYQSIRDGQLFPAIACSPDQTFFNKAILPGWQKWKPTYRYAIILDIDYENDTCSIRLLPAMSSQLSLNVNQGEDVQLGQSGYDYEISTASEPGWDQFKADNPAHPLVTNSAEPIELPSTDDLVAQIKAIDLDVNLKHIYATDASYRGIGDHWGIMAGDDPSAQANERGDCEDFALTKADKLISDLGLSPRNLQIATCYTQRGDYHACLLIPTTNHGILVLDINTFGVITKDKIDQSGYYRWDKFLINGNQWAVDVSSVLTVPVEYMNCNANAFSAGDSVIVKFIDQDFAQPKVIGFASNPGDCAYICYSMDGLYNGYEGKPLGWNPSSDVFISRNVQITQSGYKRFMASWSWGDGFITLCGGVAHLYYLDEFSSIHWTDNLSDKTQEYNTVLDSVGEKNNMPTAKAFQYGAKISDNEGLFAGGANQISGDQLLPWSQRFDGVSSVHKYNRDSNSWISRNSLSENNFYSGIFSISGKAYLIKGMISWYAGNWQFSTGSRKFDDTTNSWSAVADSFPDWFEPNSWSAGGKGWMAQGRVMSLINSDDFHVNYNPPGRPDEHWITSAHFVYDPATESWSVKQKNTASGGFGWLGRGDLSESSKDGSGINVALGNSGESAGGDFFKLSTETWHNTNDADLSGDGSGRNMGGTAGGVGMQ